MMSYNAEKREAEKMMRAADEKLLIKELGPNIYIYGHHDRSLYPARAARAG